VGADGNNGPVDDEPEVLARFSVPTRDWFTGAFAGPTSAQAGAWSAISSGEHALVVAPTGSGKTLAAFLWALDSLLSPGREGTPEPSAGAAADPPIAAVPAIERCRVLYVSPLKALAADVERNLRSPLVGIRQAATRAGLELADVRVASAQATLPRPNVGRSRPVRLTSSSRPPSRSS
jgi:ATP-dependent Lhr-like helicase